MRFEHSTKFKLLRQTELVKLNGGWVLGEMIDRMMDKRKCLERPAEEERIFRICTYMLKSLFKLRIQMRRIPVTGLDD